jgi:pantothenate synthetase
LANARDRLEKTGFDVDYFAYVDDETLAPLPERANNSTLICAARIEGTRLIDNIAV